MLSTQTARFAAARPLPVFTPSTKTIFFVQSSVRGQSPVKAALVERGYQVIHSESVEAGLRLWAKLAQPVHLFLADISLGKDPGIEELVKLLQAENPRLRVLYANDLEQPIGPVAASSYPRQLVGVIDNCLV